MNDVVKEWVEKAEADFGTALREFAVADNPNLDAACFHAQQCIEKMLKGLLIGLGVTPPYIHDLNKLAALLKSRLPNWDADDEELRLLTYAAREFRYPGETADEVIADRTLQVCKKVRLRLLGRLASYMTGEESDE